MITNSQSSSGIVDIPLDQIPSDPDKFLNNNFNPGTTYIFKKFIKKK